MKIDLPAVEEAAKELYIRALKVLPPDIKGGFARLTETETAPRAQGILATMVRNIQVAEEHENLLCQDTGVPIYNVAIGRGVEHPGHHHGDREAEQSDQDEHAQRPGRRVERRKGDRRRLHSKPGDDEIRRTDLEHLAPFEFLDQRHRQTCLTSSLGRGPESRRFAPEFGAQGCSIQNTTSSGMPGFDCAPGHARSTHLVQRPG